MYQLALILMLKRWMGVHLILNLYLLNLELFLQISFVINEENVKLQKNVKITKEFGLLQYIWRIPKQQIWRIPKQKITQRQIFKKLQITPAQ